MRYELKHDKLAAQIFLRASAAAKARRRAAEVYVLYTEKKRLLTVEELEDLAPFLPVLSPPPELQQLMERSRDSIREKEEVEKVRLERELQEKQGLLEQSQKQRKRASAFAVAGLVLAAIALVASIYALNQANIAEQAKTRALQAQGAALDSAAVARNQREMAKSAQQQSQRDANIARQKTVEAERNLKLADDNLALAKLEAARATVALEQVKKEKTATEEQRRLAEGNYLKAQESEKEAALQRDKANESYREAAEQRDKAEKALLNLEKATVDVVRAILRDADRYIMQLDYTNAWNKLREAAALNAAKQEVGTAMLELVFWYAETENFQSAKGKLDTAGQYLGEALATDGLGTETSDLLSRKKLFRSAIQQLQPEKFVTLMERYYPVESNLVKIEEGYLKRGDYLVSLSSFYLAKTEVTNWQWGLFCSATSLERKGSGWEREGNIPAVFVAWNDAINYCNWVGLQLGYAQVYTERRANWNAKGFRLPTEAEWEYAARGGPKQQDFVYSGSNKIADVAWYYGNSGNRLKPVATRKANILGIFDMSGNVWEWCWDWYADDYDPSSKINPHGPDAVWSWRRAMRRDRVLRGGSSFEFDQSCGVAFRGRGNPIPFSPHFGFRVTRTF